MRIAEVDNSGYLRARRVGELAYKNTIRIDQINRSVTSEAITLAPGEGATIQADLATPDGYMFNGIYEVASSHSIQCHISRFTRLNPTCTVNLKNTGSTTFDDVTFTMRVSFKRLVIS